MTCDDFRPIALSLSEASEGEHMNHPDFRLGGKIFASLGYPDSDFGVVMLAPEEQEKFVRSYPAVFSPAKGAWGKRGSTTVRLDLVSPAALREARAAAWRRRAPKHLVNSDP